MKLCICKHSHLQFTGGGNGGGNNGNGHNGNGGPAGLPKLREILRRQKQVGGKSRIAQK